MSARDVETVKRAFDLFAGRDVESALELIHPQVRFWLVTAAVTRAGRPYVGHDGLRQYAGDVERLWEHLELRPVEFDQVGDAVVVLGEVIARGPGGGLRQPTVWTWRLRDGLVIECRVDSSVSAARKALGEAQVIEDVLREYVEAFNRREVEEMIVLADPAIECYPSAVAGSRRKYVGHEGMRHWMRDVVALGEGHTAVAREVRRLENDRWALLGELTVGHEPVTPFVLLARVNEGLIIEEREYLSEETMLRELGHLP
jgi:ketosteroid isomerase-like protein